MATTAFSTLFGQAASSARLKLFLDEVLFKLGIESPEPEIKTYTDATYFNYYPAGLSLKLIPAEGVDMHNTTKNVGLSKGRTYSQYPLLPFVLVVPLKGSQSLSHFELKADTTGKEFVQALGEPTRKGGGFGPSSGSIGIWCEWTKLGVMVEFGGDEARGPQAWERGKDAVWKVVTLFKSEDA